MYLFNNCSRYSFNQAIVGRPPEITDYLYIWTGSSRGIVEKDEEKERFYYYKFIVSDTLSLIDQNKDEWKVVIFGNVSLINHEIFEEFLSFTHFLAEYRRVKFIFNCENQDEKVS